MSFVKYSVFELFSRMKLTTYSPEFMKKVYYEVLEYKNGQLKNMNYFANEDILHSKKRAEDLYKIKRWEASIVNASDIRYDLVLVVLDDYETNRYVLSEKNEKIQQLESMILSGLTGRTIQVLSWDKREAEMMQDYKLC